MLTLMLVLILCLSSRTRPPRCDAFQDHHAVAVQLGGPARRGLQLLEQRQVILAQLVPLDHYPADAGHLREGVPGAGLPPVRRSSDLSGVTTAPGRSAGRSR